jgi:NaMN:DMB phosphoribosyltransferase
MAAVLLIASKLGLLSDGKNLALLTTKWVYEDKNSDIKALLKMLEFSVDGLYSDFDFSFSNNPLLKLYDKGEAKEGVGAGGALCYALLKEVSKEALTKEVEKYLG